MDKLSPIQQKYNQLSKEEKEAAKRSPLFFFNSCVRKEGEPQMTQADYDKLREKQLERRSKKLGGTTPRILTPDESYILIDDTNA